MAINSLTIRVECPESAQEAYASTGLVATLTPQKDLVLTDPTYRYQAALVHAAWLEEVVSVQATRPSTESMSDENDPDAWWTLRYGPFSS